MTSPWELQEGIIAAAVAVQTGKLPGKPEQAFREQVEALLPPYFKQFGIESEPQMERATVTRGRIDMLCGRVVTEYKAPGVLSNDADYRAALDQAQGYIEELAEEFGEPLDAYYGIVLDGYHIGFLHYDQQEGWMWAERQLLDEIAAVQLLERYRAHSKYPLDAARIASTFGPEGLVVQRLMRPLTEGLGDPTGKTKLLFAEWQRLFGQAVGTEAHQYPGIVEWAQSLGVELDLDDADTIAKLFFATHTYYALVIKLITAEIVETVRSRQLSLLAEEMLSTTYEARLEMLHDLEDNILFEQYGIRNFLEGDFFSWYLGSYTRELDAGVVSMLESLSRFEPATPVLSPSHVTDLFKRLYQYLVPDRIRHDLGEFYTPDWLADYTLQRAGFEQDPLARILDPACGSGTFLVRAIRMIRKAIRGDANAIAQDDTDVELPELNDQPSLTVDLLQHIQQQNMVGLDLNPLAVVSARANLILALIEEISSSEDPVTLPIYLADSIYVPTREGNQFVYRLQTEKGLVSMAFPADLVESARFNDVLREVEDYIRQGDDKPTPENLPEDSLVATNGLYDFYEQICDLDREAWNRIWCRVIYNRFATAVIGDYDFVVGNPPWVLWSNLPASYREAVKPVCEHYDIFSDDTWVGGIESDISTVVTYAAADRWLKPGGTLAFVITQSVFKTKSAQGFRRFRLIEENPPDPAYDRIPLGVFHVDDLVSLRPFEDAQNRTAIIFLTKGIVTTFPVPYLVWKRRSRSDAISTTDPLSYIMRRVQLWPFEAAPAKEDGGPWITAPTGQLPAMLALLGGEGLHARKGTTTDFNNIFWVKPIAQEGNLVLVENNQSSQGHQVEQTRVWIEDDLVFPLARGQDVKRFSVREPELALILPQDGMRGFSWKVMASRFPNALAYFEQYETDACIGCSVGSTCTRGLQDRGSFANPKYQSAMGEYWAVWNVGVYTFAPFRVAWKEVSSRFEAAVISTAPLGVLAERSHIADHKLMILPCEREDEAHFYCGVLNSELIALFAESVSLGTSRGTRIFEDLNIPPFDPADSAHQRVAALSMAAHQGARILDEEFESELSLAVASALGHSFDEAKQLRPIEEYSDPLIEDIRSHVERFDIEPFVISLQPLDETSFVALDVETTGLSPRRHAHRIVEIGAVRFNMSGLLDSWSTVVWPSRPVDYRAQAVHGLSLDDLQEAPTFFEVVDELLGYVGDSVVVMHNAKFDWSFLQLQILEASREWNPLIVDTLSLLRNHFNLPSNRLTEALSAIGVEGTATHAALSDATATAQLLMRIIEILQERTELVVLGDLVSLQGPLRPGLRQPVSLPADLLSLAQNRAKVRLRYERKGIVGEKTGYLVAAAIGTERGYYTLEFSSGKRICFNANNVKELVPL